MYHNGVVQPVKYTATDDAFLLDGMRLNAITGSNGANGTIYAGESETFAKIISYTTSSPSNPDWFQVIAKDGSVMEFGNSTDSRFLTDNGSNIILWRLNKIIDINGNYIEFKYDNSNRSSRIQQILYTGNNNTGLLPYNKVNFVYSLRSDQSTSYEAGASINAPYLLDKAQIIHTNNLGATETIKTYKLNYGFDNVNSMLKEFVEFGGDESSASLNSTIFLYGDQPNPLSVTNTSQLVSNGFDYYTGDFDADGKSDLMSAEKYFEPTINTFLNSNYSLQKDITQGSSTTMYIKQLPPGTSNVNLLGTKLFNFLSSDYDGDGRDDILVTKTSITNVGGSTVTRRFDGVEINYTKGFNSSTGYTDYIPVNYPFPLESRNEIHSGGKFFIPGDFDGNGNQDYIVITGDVYRPYNTPPPYPGTIYTAYLTSPSTAEVNTVISNFGVGANSFPLNYSETIVNADNLNTLDFNGDGKMEIIVTKDQVTYILSLQKVNNTSYSSTLLNTTSSITKDSKYFPGDFNGDGKTDLLTRSTNGTWKILYSTGTVFIESSFSFNNSVAMSGNTISDKIVVADFNGDGKSDIFHGFPVWVNGVATTSKMALYYPKIAGVSSSTFQYEMYDYNSLFGAELVLGDFNGDGRSDFINRNSTSSCDFIAIKPLGQERLLRKVTTGHNVTTSFDYKLLTDKSIYPYIYQRTISLDDPANKNPFNYVQLPMYALSAMTIPDGVGGNNITEYKYENAVVHRAAKGFLGFKKVTAVNNISGTTSVSENQINTQFALLYPVKQTATLTSNSSLLSESTISNSFVDLSTGFLDKRYFQRIDRTLSLDQLNGKASESVNTYDAYGNVTATISKVGYMNGSNITASETANTTTTYGLHNTPVPAKPNSVTVTNTRTGMPAISATKSYTYRTNGLLQSETSFYGLPKAVTTSFIYNGFGNPLSQTISAAGLSNSITTNTFDSKGRFATQKQTAAGTAIAQTETATTDGKWGKILSSTSSDCLTSSNSYDAFGKLIQTTLPDGNIISTNEAWLVSTNSLFYATAHSTGGSPDTRVYYDKFGRQYKSEKESLASQSGSWHTVLTTYNNKGAVSSKTNSFFPLTESARITNFQYDIYGRPVGQTNYTGTATIVYAALGNGNTKVTATDPSGKVSEQITDASGIVISAKDNGGELFYTYDSRGKQTAVKHGTTTVISSSYDDYGNQVSLTDLNAGTIQYNYDAYGRLTQQQDAKGNTTTMAYDELSRPVSKTITEGTITYAYYKNPFLGCSNNNLTQVTNFNGIVRSYRYDALARLIRTTQSGTSDGLTHVTNYGYNAFSGLLSTTYPSGVTEHNTYDINGYVIKKSASGTGLSELTDLYYNPAVDGEGKMIAYTLGNGKTTTKTYNNDFPLSSVTPAVQNLSYNFQANTGNLLQRSDILTGQSETFTYDNLNRLTNATVNNNVQFALTYDGSSANSMGNIDTKTDAGYYKYRSDKKHAVAYITATPVSGQSPVTPTPVSTISQDEQQITYTSFLKTYSITENSLISSPPFLRFDYGADYERVMGTSTMGRGAKETRYYDGSYEEQKINSGAVTSIHYIAGGDGLSAMLITENGVTTPYYTYTDYLGSILTVTNAAGSIVATQNFDAWGRNRNPANWNQHGNSSLTQTWLYRGYTGHEMLPNYAMVNMNGRMYDPILGRMLSPDPYVPTPYGTQGYNRYTYAMNNPLKYTDPDGNFVHLVVGAFIGGTLNWIMNGAQFNARGLGYFGVGALAGAVGAGIGAGVNVGMAGGSFSAGFMGTAAGVSSTGFIAGFATGASAGIASGFISGSGNSFVSGDNIGQALGKGLNQAWKQGISGGLGGGIAGGIDAISKDVNFFSGATKMDLSSGYGAHGVSTDQNIFGKRVGSYTDLNIPVYESSSLDAGAGLTLPGRGIIVSKGAFSRGLDPRLMEHEFGHIMQARKVGFNAFYNVIAKESVISAAMGSNHRNFWTETWANYLSKEYQKTWYIGNSVRFPIQNISDFNLLRLRLNSPFFFP